MATSQGRAPEAITAAPAPIENEEAERAAHTSLITQMREHFSKQRRVRIRIPKEAGEQFVQVNGYSFQIQAGVPLEVPEDVAVILQDAGII